MPNSIKQSADGLALQVTKPARAAGLAEEATEDGLEGPERWARLADVCVYCFDSVILVVDRERMDVADVADLVATTARDTKSIYTGQNASVRPAGNGCMVSLPGVRNTGLGLGDTAPAHPAPNMLVITPDTKDGTRIANDLKSIRQSQVE